jgi:hypothetical protein
MSLQLHYLMVRVMLSVTLLGLEVMLVFNDGYGVLTRNEVGCSGGLLLLTYTVCVVSI